MVCILWAQLVCHFVRIKPTEVGKVRDTAFDQNNLFPSMDNISELVNEHPFDASLQAIFLKHTRESEGIAAANMAREISFELVDFSDSQWSEWIEDSKEGGVPLLVDVISKAFLYHPSPAVLAACVDSLSLVTKAGWNEWVVFSKRPTSEKSAIRFMEQALDKISLWPESGTVWESARKFLSSTGLGVESIRKLFMRQLQAVPMKPAMVDSLRNELRVFEETVGLEPISVDTSGAEKIWKSWSSLESTVHGDSSLWLDMIEKRSPIDPPEYVASLYGRAVIFDSKNEDHWIRYFNKTSDEEMKKYILERGVKNCPFSGRLWNLLIQTVPSERTGRYIMLGTSALRDALHIKGNHQFLCELLLHDAQIKSKSNTEEAREAFQNAVSILSEISAPMTVGATIAWVHAETYIFGDSSSAEDILNEFLFADEWVQKRISCTPLQWVQLAWLARQTRNPELCRKIYTEAIQSVEDKHKSIVFQDWILFERSFGTIQVVANLENRMVEVAQSLLTKDLKRKTPPVVEKTEETKRVKTDAPAKPPVLNVYPNCVFIKDLPFSASEETVSRFFESECTISRPQRVLIVKNSLGRSRGFGYAEFDTPENAQHAIKCSGKIMDGRSLTISASTRAITVKRDKPISSAIPHKLEEEKERTNEYFRTLIMQKKRLAES